jgi:hypothetical protein
MEHMARLAMAKKHDRAHSNRNPFLLDFAESPLPFGSARPSILTGTFPQGGNMTTSSISSSYLQNLYSKTSATAATPAASLALPSPIAAPTRSAATASTNQLPVQDPPTNSSYQSALAKLNQIDPSLGQALKAFQADPVAVSATASQGRSSDPPPTPIQVSPTASKLGRGRAHHHHGGATPTKPTITETVQPLSVAATAAAASTLPPASAAPNASLASFVRSQFPSLSESFFATAA